jgi:thymidylate synthase
MKNYLELVNRVLKHGTPRNDRTGVGTIATFGNQVTFDLREGFPATTTKRLAFKQVVGELLCFIHGERMLEDFHKRGVHIWDANATAEYWTPAVPGDTGRIYGVNWRDWRSVDSLGHIKFTDQLVDLIKNLKDNPYSRRNMVVTYNPGELDQVCLPACHVLFQCFVENGYLDLRFDMRSVDLFLGAPFDIASYAILQTMLATEVGLRPRFLVMQTGDTHIYLNHIEQVKEMLRRKPKQAPVLYIDPTKSFFEITESDIKLLDYNPHPTISAEMAV